VKNWPVCNPCVREQSYSSKLDSMRWFSHRHRSAPRTAAEKNAARGRRRRGRLPNKIPHCRFLSPISLTFDLWPWHSNSGEIFVRCTLPPSFTILRLIVRNLSCWQTDRQTDAAENIHLSPLYATPVVNSEFHFGCTPPRTTSVNVKNCSWHTNVIVVNITFYDFCSFWSVAVNSVYNSINCIFAFAVLLPVFSRLFCHSIQDYTANVFFGKWTQGIRRVSQSMGMTTNLCVSSPVRRRPINKIKCYALPQKPPVWTGRIFWD